MTEEFDWTPFEGDRWSPDNPGDEIIGTITAIVTKDGKAGTIPVLTITEKDTERSVEVWASQTMLKQSLADLRPQVADQIAIRLTELRQTGQPSPMKVFSVRHKPAEDDHGMTVEDVGDEEPF